MPNTKLFTSSTKQHTRKTSKNNNKIGLFKKQSTSSSITLQTDLTQNIIRNQREFLSSEINSITGYDNDIIIQIKHVLERVNKAVHYFNSNFYADAYTEYASIIQEIIEIIPNEIEQQMLNHALNISHLQEHEYGSWTLRLALCAIIDSKKKGYSTLHLCCSSICGDPYILLNFLRVDKRYREVFPLPSGYKERGSYDIDINQVTDNMDRLTALHLACELTSKGANLCLIHILLKSGANINIQDSNGITPFDIALRDNNIPLIALLTSQRDLNTVPKELYIPKELNFSNLGMTNYPERLSFLVSNLQVLDLSKNPIVSLPNALSLLINLTSIILNDMNLRIFPSCLFTLIKLEYIDLKNNVIAHIPTHIEYLINLKTLKLRNNNLNSLPSSLSKLTKLQKLTLERNPLESIPKEVINRGLSSLLAYLKDMEGQVNTWKRIKLLVLGEEATGKTSLLNCFQYKNKTSKGFKRRSMKTLSTDGLNINYWKPDPGVEFQTWDFAGQQVFYPTHQFFLSSRCIYIITFNTMNLNASRPKYWVRQISAVARDKPPIFFVGTHIDDSSCSETLMLSTKSKLQSLFNFRTHNIIDCLFISSKTGDGIKELISQLILTALSHNMLKQMVPGNYILLDKMLSQERKKHEWVRWSTYITWALQCNISKNNLSLTTRFLHDVGSLIYFDNTPALRDIVILDPQWLANIFASLITFNHKWISDGILNSTDLNQIWKQYPHSLYPKLLMLLTKFGVACPLEINRSSSNISKQYIIPSLLNENKPDIANNKWIPNIQLINDNIIEFGRLYTFNFTFEFSKILVSLLHAKNLRVDCFWKLGIIITDIKEKGNQQGLLQWLPNSSQLKFNIRMDKYEFNKSYKMDLLRQIIEIIDSILEGFYCGSPSIKREVLCSHCLSHKSSLLEGVYQFSLENLLSSVTEGKWIVYCRNVPTRPVNIRYLAPDIGFCDFPIIPTNKYSIIKEVGRGGFGVVYLAQLAGIDVAIKELLLNVGDSLDSLDEQDSFRKFAEFQQEVYVMSALNHINLVKLYGISLNPLRMIMEWCGSGDLWHLLHPKENEKKINISWKLRYKIALDIAKGMCFLQNVTPPIVHRDLRSPNIFLVSINENDPVCAKVADFGLSRHVENFLGETLPTWRWLAPEVIDFESQKYDERSDIYSFAIILWELITADIPYDEYNQMSTLDIRRGIITGKLRPSIPESVDKRYASLIRQCWRNQPNDRLPLIEAVNILSEILGIDSNINSSYIPFRINENILKEIQLPQLNDIEYNKEDSYTNKKQYIPKLITTKEKLRDKPVTCLLAVGKRIWCGFADGYVSIYDSASQSLVGAFEAFDKSCEIFSMLETKNGTVWIASKGVRIFDIKTFKRKKSIASKDYVISMTSVFLGNVEFIWIADYQGNLTVWNNLASTSFYKVKIGEPIYTIQQYGDYVWLGLYRKLLIYQAKTAVPYASGDTNQLKSLLLFQDEMWGALNDNFVFIWDIETITIKHSLEGHTGIITCLAKIDETIWTGSFDTNILIWDPIDHTCITELSDIHKGKILSIVQCESYVWTSSEDNIVCVWKIPE